MAEEDYDSSNTSYILQDEEPDEVLFDSSKRKFKVNEPLQVSVTGQKELMLRFYSPRAIHNVIVWATVEGYEAVSYTHLDVYKRQAPRRDLICLDNRSDRTASI